MSNRILSLLIITLVFASLFGVYHYFFVLSTGNISLILNGSGSASIVLTSEFGNIYTRDCDRSCLFDNIPAVTYTVSAKRSGYADMAKTVLLGRGETKKVMIAMEKEILLSEQKKKKEETISAIKLKRDIQETIETNTGSTILGYRANTVYYTLPSDDTTRVFMKKDTEQEQELFKIPNGTLKSDALDIYEGYIAQEKDGDISFYLLKNGEKTSFNHSGKILGIKDTQDNDTKIITGDDGVFMYTVSEGTARKNPLYDDIIQLPSGEVVALVKKTSKEKQSILSITDSSNDLVFLIGQDTRERKVLLQTPKNGKLLRYKDGEILFVDKDGGVFVVENVK